MKNCRLPSLKGLYRYISGYLLIVQWLPSHQDFIYFSFKSLPFLTPQLFGQVLIRPVGGSHSLLSVENLPLQKRLKLVFFKNVLFKQNNFSCLLLLKEYRNIVPWINLVISCLAICPVSAQYIIMIYYFNTYLLFCLYYSNAN